MTTMPAPPIVEVAQASARQEFLRAASDMGEDRLKWYAKYDDYYDGIQHTLLMERAKQYLMRSGLPYAENFCDTIVDVLAARLTVEGFSCEGGAAAYKPTGEDAAADKAEGDKADPAQDLASQLGEWWQRCRMDAKQGVIHTTAVKKGDAFLIVDYDQTASRPRFTYNRPEIVKPVYDDDDPDTMLYAVKVWNSKWRDPAAVGSEQEKPTKIRRMNIYWPDRVEKWFSTVVDHGNTSSGMQANWMAWMDEGDTTWPVMWLRNDGTPRGIPVFHFRHKPHGSTYGVSKLRGVMPQQDALNKSCLDLFMIMDNEGVPQRYVTGMSDTTTEGLFKTAPGEVWKGGDGVQFGQFAGADVGPILEAINSQLSRMGARSKTPLHLLNPTGVLPSGETLKVAEAPLVKEVEDVEVFFGDTWEDSVRMAVGLHNDYAADGEPRFDETLIINTQWDGVASRDDLAQAQTASLWHDMGVSAATLMGEAGYNPEEEREKRDEENQRAMDAGGLLAGLPTGTAPMVPEDGPGAPVDGPPAVGA